MHEFDLIDQFFKPLATPFSGSLNLSDDAALIHVPEGHELVITKDAISEGIHFIGDEDPALIAKKLLRTNLSDLAAKGAKPLAYFLALMLPKTISADWVKQFAQGLEEDQALFNIHLAGGDTISTLGPASFSLTALGTVKTGTMLRRNGAQVGDIIVVSGTLGDSALGLKSLQKKLDFALREQDKHYLEDRYLLPQPRLELGLSLHKIANACMDISDGLVQDLEHLCKTSGVGAEIEIGKLPLSAAAKNCIAANPELITLPLTGGDDYELLFTVPHEKISTLPTGCTAIGTITKGHEISVLGANKKNILLKNKGFIHFS